MHKMHSRSYYDREMNVSIPFMDTFDYIQAQVDLTRRYLSTAKLRHDQMNKLMISLSELEKAAADAAKDGDSDDENAAVDREPVFYLLMDDLTERAQIELRSLFPKRELPHDSAIAKLKEQDLIN